MPETVNFFQTDAFGHPGITPRWTSSSKEGVGTAYSTASRVWFTISHGILNEVFYPTIDRPQTRDLQFLITDGQTFFHEERRDLVHSLEPIEKDTLGYHLVNEDKRGRYRIIKEVIADPHQACVLIHARLEGSPEVVNNLKVYALLSPHLEVGGMGNSGRRMRLAGREILTAWKNNTWLAFGADPGFLRTSCGYVRYSDGWQDLKDNFRMDWTFDQALDGNIALMGEIDPSGGREFTLGLAFGDSLHAAGTVLFQSLAIPFSNHRLRYVEQWGRVCCDLKCLDEVSGDGGKLYRISRDLLLAHEDKTFAGAIVASASIPWGQVRGDEDIGGYHLVWTRDLVKSAGGLLATAGYLVEKGPVTQQERWEENGGFSPSTLAAVIAACLCAAAMAREQGRSVTARFLEEYADFLESHVETWTVTTRGELVPGISRHYIRLNPADVRDLTPNENPDEGMLRILNRPPDRPDTFPARNIIDAALKVDAPQGPCWRRYNHDGYGQRDNGGPFQGFGQGRAWPLLTGERGHYELAAGRNPRPFIQAMENFALKGTMIPEQVWDEPDRPEVETFFGGPAGSAMPLVWAHSEYIKLLRSAADGKVFDRLPVVADRYLQGAGRKDLEIWMPRRQVRAVSRGQTLRLQCPTPFRVRWTLNDWGNDEYTDSIDSGIGIHYGDLPVPQYQTTPVEFTFFWTTENRWEGKNYQVQVL